MSYGGMSAEAFKDYKDLLEMRYKQVLYVAREVGRDDVAKLGVSTNPQKRRRVLNATALEGKRAAIYWRRPLFLREYVMPLRSAKPIFTWTEFWVRRHLAAHAIRYESFPGGVNEWYALSPRALVEAIRQMSLEFDVIHLTSPRHYAEYLLDIKEQK